MEIVGIWFQLIMIYQGHVYWLGAWENQEDCREVQAAYEHRYPKARLACPFVRIEKT